MNKYLETQPDLPPYGIMNNDYLTDLGSKNLLGSPAVPIVPPEFEPVGRDASQHERYWVAFRDDLLDKIADALWPVWDPKSQSWIGRSANAILDLTHADLDILLSLRVGARPLSLNTLPSSTLRSLNCPAHSAFFVEEDQFKIFASYAHYDRTLDSKYPSIFSDVFFAGLDAKCSSTQLQFKQRFQRPRPYQTAFLLSKREFNLESAASSMTPSMVSGHSLQGLIGVGAVMEQIVQSAISFSEDSWQALSQYAVDIGDRRVMAGVHYPSDNLSSWIVLMRLANHIYKSPGIKEKLWKAITNQSFVYRLIHDSKAKVYSAGLNLLNDVHESE